MKTIAEMTALAAESVRIQTLAHFAAFLENVPESVKERVWRDIARNVLQSIMVAIDENRKDAFLAGANFTIDALEARMTAFVSGMALPMPDPDAGFAAYLERAETQATKPHGYMTRQRERDRSRR